MRAFLRVAFQLFWLGCVAWFLFAAGRELLPDIKGFDFKVRGYLTPGAAYYATEGYLALGLLAITVLTWHLSRGRLFRLRVTFLLATLTVSGAFMLHAFKAAAYYAAIDTDSVKAYDDFLIQYSTSRFVPDVRSRRDAHLDSTFSATLQMKNTDELRRLVSQYPDHGLAGAARKHISDIDWAEVARQPSADAYRNFADRNPMHEKAEVAVRLAGDLVWQQVIKDDTVAAYEQFAHDFPNHEHAILAKERFRVDIHDLAQAIAVDLIEAVVVGNGLNSVRVTLRRKKAGRFLRVEIPAGTYFASTGYAQNMIARSRVEVSLTGRDPVEAEVPASCANFHRPTPGPGDAFTVVRGPNSNTLRRLAATASEAAASEVVFQVATWVVTDNVSREELESTYTRSSVSGFGGSPAASEQDIQAAKRLLEQAGISTSDKALFRPTR